jgi:3D-(3,5/4)-trihydroxycyclohexane-1,2-dione acylhydrolase (decyclizing)
MMKEKKNRYTLAQALVLFLDKQYVERDGRKHKFFAGVWGIFGHGNVAGLGQALEQYPQLPYYQARNEQAMVHAAAAFAKQNRRLSTFACTSSIGPGASNMITAAAAATINRLPVLLLPGDTFACRQRGPVLQELEHPHSYNISVNDCFRPISRFWDRIHRCEQLAPSLKEAMRVLSSPNETGAVTLCLPQDVQAEAGYFENSLFEERVHSLPRMIPDPACLTQIAERITKSKRPLLIAGGGVLYSEAEHELAEFCKLTKIPSCETQAGKGSLSYKHEQNIGALGVTGTQCANRIASQADLIIVLGSRLSDFTSASGTQFSNPSVKFININVDSRDAHKYDAFPLLSDCRRALEELRKRLVEKNYQTSLFYQEEIQHEKNIWSEIRSSLLRAPEKGISQASVLGLLNQHISEEDTLVSAAGSLPGDMHKLIEVSQSTQYHMEYGYSCMGYEIAGSLGVKFQKQKGDVFTLVGDGSYLMMHSDLVTSLQEHKKLIVVLIINDKFACIDNLSKASGSQGFGNEFRYRSEQSHQLDGEYLKIDYMQNALSLGLDSVRVRTVLEFKEALVQARASNRSFLIAVEVSESANVPSYDTRWDVPVAEVSTSTKVIAARAQYESIFKNPSSRAKPRDLSLGSSEFHTTSKESL